MSNRRWIRITEAGAAMLLSLSGITGCAAPGRSAPEQGDLTEVTAPDTTATDPQQTTLTTPTAPRQTDTTAATGESGESGEPGEPPHTYTLPELVHSSAAEIIRLMGGEYEMMADEIPGYFYLCNEQVFPHTRFYFIDTSFDYIPQGDSSLSGYEPQLREMLMHSGIEIDKINTYAGGMEIDGYTAGRRYADYAEQIGADSFSFGDLGEYFCGAPASSAFSYTDAENHAQITLHFTLTGDYMTKEDFVMAQGAFPEYIMGQDNPELEVITVKRDDGYPKPEFTVATASSVLAPEVNGDSVYTYAAENVLDGDLSTCWAEGAEGLGYGETLTLTAAEPQTVSSIRVYGGLQTDAAHFRSNGRPTELRAEFDDGSVYRVWVSDNLDYGSLPVFLCSGKKTSTIKLTLQAITAGENYQDTCISEIEFD
ncbi:MAG: discoidin domain-containing protein [Oscillospiraceae bacterium]|nr:discoidin domain-containing protein [Oscillospiraceae bacterium]